MPDPNYSEIRNLPRITIALLNSLILVDNPTGLVTNSMTIQDFLAQINANVKSEFFPSSEGFTPSPSTTVNQYCAFQFMVINTYTDAPDSIRMMSIYQPYYDYFYSNLVNLTDWMVADGSALPNDSWHVLMNDGITNIDDYRGRVPSGVDSSGSVNPDNAGVYSGQTQDDTMQRLTGQFGDVLRGTFQDNEGVFEFGGQTYSNRGTVEGPNTWGYYTFDNARQARTSEENRSKNTKTVFIQRYKFTNF